MEHYRTVMEKQADSARIDPSQPAFTETTTDRLQEPDIEIEQLATYADGDSVVFCDRSNAKCWIRSDTVVDLER